ncbi:MAG: hypothetical protein JXQ83_15225 [Candidatus Glassbacteria bacterium]|nr:hypothetical protein [Candidatus Glassbacteria bacterium]
MLRWLRVFPLILSLCILPVLCLPGIAAARIEAGAGLSLAWPQGEFKDEVNFAWGGGARLGWSFNDQAAGGVSLFFDLSYLNYGRERRVEPFSYTIPDVVVDVVTDNHMVLASPGVQVGLRRGWIRPYGEFYGGFTYIATTTKIENRGLIGEEIASSTNFSDWTYNVGFGGGIQVPLWQRKAPAPETIREIRLSEALLDLKFGYKKGGDALYLKKGSIGRGDSGQVRYDYRQSSTDLFLVRIGVSFRF